MDFAVSIQYANSRFSLMLISQLENLIKNCLYSLFLVFSLVCHFFPGYCHILFFFGFIGFSLESCRRPEPALLPLLFFFNPINPALLPLLSFFNPINDRFQYCLQSPHFACCREKKQKKVSQRRSMIFKNFDLLYKLTGRIWLLLDLTLHWKTDNLRNLARAKIVSAGFFFRFFAVSSFADCCAEWSLGCAAFPDAILLKVSVFFFGLQSICNFQKAAASKISHFTQHCQSSLRSYCLPLFPVSIVSQFI